MSRTTLRNTVAIAALLMVGAAGWLSSAQEISAEPEEPVRIVNPWPDPGDAFGHAVAIGPGAFAVGAPGDDTLGEDAGVAHVYGGDLLLETVAASDAAPADRFGSSLAMDAQLLVVGAPGSGGTGAAYVFAPGEGDRWREVARLQPSSPVVSEGFGTSVAVDRNTIVIGAPFEDSGGNLAGAVYVFERSGQLWVQSARLTLGGGSGLIFGSGVAIEGDVIVAGGPFLGFEFARGTAWVFVRDQDGWRYHQELDSPLSTGRDRFGSAAAISHGRIVVGAPRDSLPPFGFFTVFEPSGEAGTGSRHWDATQAEISPEPSNVDLFGRSVDLFGKILAVGAPGAGESGGAYLFRLDQDGWILDRPLAPEGLAVGAKFGASVAVGPTGLIVGAPGEGAGVVYRFP